MVYVLVFWPQGMWDLIFLFFLWPVGLSGVSLPHFNIQVFMDFPVTDFHGLVLLCTCAELLGRLSTQIPLEAGMQSVEI